MAHGLGLQRCNRQQKGLTYQEVVVSHGLLAGRKEQEHRDSIRCREHRCIMLSGSDGPGNKRQYKHRSDLHHPREWDGKAQAVMSERLREMEQN